MNNDNGKVLYSTKQACRALSICEDVLRQLAKEQKIGHIRHGKGARPSYKFTRQDLEAYVATLERVNPK